MDETYAEKAVENYIGFIIPYGLVGAMAFTGKCIQHLISIFGMLKTVLR
jgi:hypothetical protein